MKRCTVIIPDAGPFNSLWVADRLDLLLALDMRLVVVDAVYDELTSDLSYPKDRAVKAFIDSPLAFALDTPGGMTLLTNVAVCLLWIATLWPMYRRFGAAITLFSGLIILQSAFFIVSQGRMLLPAIGVYITLAALVESRPRWPVLKYGLVITFAVSMTMLGLMFANGQWIV